ncbi:MAG TPA: HoxN/HupN/NixA family nickel/cobalt transporter [Chloroflexia bacterium]|nr:HoxN/HupN/NixA family nickel/cobalt transporter [Chloroflexia bacterium]
MLRFLGRILNDSSPQVRRKVFAIYTVLITFNLAVWGLTLLVSTQYGFVLGTALLAYTFGLRHGVDADHIAAIDNVTRKLMQEKKRPVAVGLFFSLGHSTIVVALSVIIAIIGAVVQDSFDGLKNVGGLIGTGVSAFFLYVIGIINLLVLIDIFRMLRRVVKGGSYSEETLEEFLAQRGMMNRFFGPLMRAIDRSWKMYPLGVLFGLGFDTATEVGLLGISATTAGSGTPVYVVLLFPFLFMAGMTLVDTTDSILMLGAYGWAFVKPIRKLYYNFNITLVSVLIALVIGTMEALSIFANEFNLSGQIWGWVSNLDFEVIGYLIIGIFVLSWGLSTLVYKLKKFDDIEVEVIPGTSGTTS